MNTYKVRSLNFLIGIQIAAEFQNGFSNVVAVASAVTFPPDWLSMERQKAQFIIPVVPGDGALPHRDLNRFARYQVCNRSRLGHLHGTLSARGTSSL